MACPRSDTCDFGRIVSSNVIKRVKFASAYPYCRGGRHDSCAIHGLLERGRPVPEDLLPDGQTGSYRDREGRGDQRFLVIEDSPVFAALAASTIANHFTGAEIVRHTSFTDAEDDLRAGRHSVVVCGFGLGDGRTANDVRRLTTAPIVVLTGRPGQLELPFGARQVSKGAGPEALVSAINASLA
jgi:hypothetical protein